MFDSILIANRGEIACRIIRTARRMGVRAVAVYSEADAGAMHVAMADAAFCIGPAPAAESYLAIPRILDAAARAGAQAIHPGYGFLSENAAFAEACAAAGVTFIGPPAAAIRAMGSKSAAKALMDGAGVPLVPGYHGADQDDAVLEDAAARIGYPVLIKASAGGGGRGMRVVPGPGAFAASLATARGAARAAFGDDTVLVERYLTRPRHIEMQVFADTHDNVVALFERDCSVQRRHQKVIEEAPAPGLDAATRERMAAAACAAARAIGYVGAGTVEFIAEDGAFYFMEMNTRLQVEHPVTEMITGLDLVEWQLRVAAGEALPRRQDELAATGHAIEVRIYAEDPARDFAPATGTLQHLRAPAEDAAIRVDTGVRQGDAISVHYDPMIAKLIAHGADRPDAVRRLARALDDYEIAGVQTNLGLLRAIVRHPAFRAGGVDTGFIATHAADLMQPPAPPPRAALAAAVHRLLADARPDGDTHSPWALRTAWRLNGDGYQDFHLLAGETALMLRAHLHRDGNFRLDLPDGAAPDGAADVAVGPGDDGAVCLALDGMQVRARVLRSGPALTVLLRGEAHALTYVDPLAPAREAAAGGDRIVAPMPGRVLEIAAAGRAVRRGEVVVVLEAMKVQMRLPAPRDAVIAAVGCARGDLVEDGAELVSFVPAE
ncbi:MAG: acetyl-CoA carboxylase biotin carboxylase subunit [Alphaproteobacteria bacterium]|nr:acetyl-CoA carboxylase biotin carboxylase subunit [Alphaproteobacteria bacterium]